MAEFEEILHLTSEGIYPTHIAFRGGAKFAYDLSPTFARYSNMTGEDVFNSERLCYDRFREEAREYLETNLYLELRGTLNPVLWWTVIQHYGAPTRLLDWTASPYTALYFACRTNADAEGVVWIWHMEKTMEHQESISEPYHTDMLKGIASSEREQVNAAILPSPNTPNLIARVRTNHRTRRVSAQQGLFSICNRPDLDHESVIPSDHLFKIKIEQEAKYFLMSKLRTMNITAKSLFPDIHGVCEYAKEALIWGDPPY